MTAVIVDGDWFGSDDESPQWAPSTRDVAVYVTSRTLDLTQPGNDTPTGDFTATTWPTGPQVERIIKDSVAWVATSTGWVAASLYPMAAACAAVHAAGMVELSYPIRDADVSSTAQMLLDEAHRHLLELVAANAGATGQNPNPDPSTLLLPRYSFPAATPWRDYDYL